LVRRGAVRRLETVEHSFDVGKARFSDEISVRR
jgi:hypothetical protein